VRKGEGEEEGGWQGGDCFGFEEGSGSGREGEKESFVVFEEKRNLLRGI